MEGYIDLRELSGNGLFRLRKRVVRLKEKGYSGKAIGRLVHIRENRVSEIWQSYLSGGTPALRPGAAGRKPGGSALLTAQDGLGIRQTMIERTPDRLKMPYSLWTRQIACDFVRREYGVRLQPRSMTNYFKKWGFVCIAPARSEGFRGRKGFRRFMEDSFPAIVRRAASENVGIYWFSEAWIPKGPPQDGDGGAQRTRMVAAVTARGTARFTFYEGRLSQEKCIALMGRLIRYADRKVFFIAADIRPFRGKKTMAWLKGREAAIEVFYYPVT